LTNLPIEYFENWEDTLRNADLAVIQSDWNEIRGITSEDFKRLLITPIVIDGRRTYDPNQLISNGIKYYGIGWKNRIK